MAWSLIFIAFQIIFGLLVVEFFDPKKKFQLLELLILAGALGLIFGFFLTLVFALLFKSLEMAILTFQIFTLALLLWQAKGFIELLKKIGAAIKNYRNLFKRENLPILLLIAIILVYAFAVPTVLFKNNDGYLRSALVGWGDTAFHISLIERFATADPFNLTHPILGNAALAYPFMIDFASAVFKKMGAGMIAAFRLPLYFMGVLWILLLYCAALRVLKSRLFAALALVIIIFGSGLGFITLFKDVKGAYVSNSFENVSSFIQNPPHEYTHLDNRTGGKSSEKNTEDNIVWMVPFISFFLHQRSFAFGLLLFSMVLLGILTYGNDKSFWRFGIIAGLLPFAHGHTLLGLFFALAALFWFYRENRRSWVKFGFITAILALPQIAFFKTTSMAIGAKIFRPWFGWMTCDHRTSWFFCEPGIVGTDTNPIFFWSKNFGVVFFIWTVVIIIAALAIFSPRLKLFTKKNFEFKFIFASLTLFLMTNLFIFQPWPFDNNKAIFYWWFLAIIFAVMPFFKWLSKKRLWGKILVGIMVFFAVLAGSFDSGTRLAAPRSGQYFGYNESPKAKLMAEWIKENTAPNDLFLTAPKIDAIPLFLAGRPIYFGYEGWLWSHGLDYANRKTAANEIAKGNLETACRENIKYLLLDDDFKKEFKEVNATALITEAETVFSDNDAGAETLILKINCQS